jgi:hypothetical protein
LAPSVKTETYPAFAKEEGCEEVLLSWVIEWIPLTGTEFLYRKGQAIKMLIVRRA